MTDRITKERRAELRRKLERMATSDYIQGVLFYKSECADLLALLDEKAEQLNEPAESKSELCPICLGTRIHGHVLGGTNPATCYACAGAGFIVRDQPASPTSGEREEILKWFDHAWPKTKEKIGRIGPPWDELGDKIKAILLSAPAPPRVTREAFDSACEKFSGHWNGTLDDIKRLGESILGDLGVIVEDKSEGEE